MGLGEARNVPESSNLVCLHNFGLCFSLQGPITASAIWRGSWFCNQNSKIGLQEARIVPESSNWDCLHIFVLWFEVEVGSIHPVAGMDLSGSSDHHRVGAPHHHPLGEGGPMSGARLSWSANHPPGGRDEPVRVQWSSQGRSTPHHPLGEGVMGDANMGLGTSQRGQT